MPGREKRIWERELFVEYYFSTYMFYRKWTRKPLPTLWAIGNACTIASNEKAQRPFLSVGCRWRIYYLIFLQINFWGIYFQSSALARRSDTINGLRKHSIEMLKGTATTMNGWKNWKGLKKYMLYALDLIHVLNLDPQPSKKHTQNYYKYEPTGNKVDVR